MPKRAGNPNISRRECGPRRDSPRSATHTACSAQNAPHNCKCHAGCLRLRATGVRMRRGSGCVTVQKRRKKPIVSPLSSICSRHRSPSLPPCLLRSLLKMRLVRGEDHSPSTPPSPRACVSIAAVMNCPAESRIVAHSRIITSIPLERPSGSTRRSRGNGLACSIIQPVSQSQR